MGLFSKLKKDTNYDIKMPIDGNVVNLSEVPDQVFAEKLMGDGFAINPVNGTVTSPVDATIETVFPTGHAIGLNVNENVQILIHIGLDTVNLNGEGFKTLVKEGDKVKAGDVLVEFDFEAVKSKVPSVVTPVIFTKLDGYKFSVEYKDAKKGEVIGSITK